MSLCRCTHTRKMSDRDLLIRAEARELYRHWELTKDATYPKARAKVVHRLYGPGADKEIRQMINEFQKGWAE